MGEDLWLNPVQGPGALVFGLHADIWEVTTGKRAPRGTARALEPSCLGSDMGPATWGQLLGTFVLLQMLPLVLGC